MRLLVADHDPLCRQAVRQAMSKRGDIDLVSEAAFIGEAVTGTVQHAPDVALIDADLPPLGGIAATAQLMAIDPALRVVVFSVREDEELALSGLEAGAAGFLNKDIDMSALARALISVSRGEAAISRRLALRTVTQLRSAAIKLRDMRPVESPLTDRQWQVLKLIEEGRTAAEIAEELHVSASTVRSHLRLSLRTLGARTPAEAVAAADRLRGGASISP